MSYSAQAGAKKQVRDFEEFRLLQAERLTQEKK